MAGPFNRSIVCISVNLKMLKKSIICTWKKLQSHFCLENSGIFIAFMSSFLSDDHMISHLPGVIFSE